MFLCRSPVVANDFWNDLVSVQNSGVQVDRTIAASVAKKHDCQFVASDRLRPIRFVAGQFAMTDGTVTGWASPQLLIIYENRAESPK